MIRGAIYRVDAGEARGSQEQRGPHYGLVMSPGDMPWGVVTVIPTSTSAPPAAFRPQLEILGETRRFLVDQIRTVDTRHVHGDPVGYLERAELEAVEEALALYLGL